MAEITMTNPKPSPNLDPVKKPVLQRTVPRVPAILPIGRVGNREQISHNWWAVLLRGLLGMAFGVAAFFAPKLALATAIAIFGAFALVDGVFLLVAGVRTRTETSKWWLLAIQGLLGIIMGVVAFFYPLATAVALLVYVAIWAVITGVLEIAAAWEIRKEIEHEWMLFLAGGLSIVLGVFLIAQPELGLMVSLWWMGLYAFVSGAFLVGLAFRLRGEDTKCRKEYAEELAANVATT